MVSFTQTFVAAAIAFAAIASAKPIDHCAHKIHFDFSQCVDTNMMTYKPAFVSKDYFYIGNDHRRVSLQATTSELCIPYNEIKGHVYLGYQNANVDGTNVEAVRVQFFDGYAKARVYTHYKNGKPVSPQTDHVAEIEILGSDGHVIVSSGKDGKIVGDGKHLGLRGEFYLTELDHARISYSLYLFPVLSTILQGSSPKVEYPRFFSSRVPRSTLNFLTPYHPLPPTLSCVLARAKFNSIYILLLLLLRFVMSICDERKQSGIRVDFISRIVEYFHRLQKQKNPLLPNYLLVNQSRVSL